MADADIQNALIAIFDVLIKFNQYVTAMEPWVLLKKDKSRLQTVLYVMVDCMRIIAALLSPVMPTSARKIQDHLGVPDSLRSGSHIFKFGLLTPGTPFSDGEPEILFQKVKLEDVSPNSNSKPSKPVMKEADDATALEIRLGRVISVKRHPDAANLYIEEIDVGEDKTRQIVSGLVQHIPESELLNALVLVVCNIPSAVLKGVTSYGMLLVAVNSDGHMELIQIPEKVAVGELVTYPPLHGVGFVPGSLLAKRKYQRLLQDLKTDAHGFVCWKDAQFTLSSGPCVSTFKNASVK
jgi:methionine--tRNA ligase beta chain